jgi:hypothetical protein
MPDGNEALVAHQDTNSGRIHHHPGLWLAPDNDRNELAHERSFGPCAHKLKKELLLFFGFGLTDPKQSLGGIFSKLLGL